MSVVLAVALMFIACAAFYQSSAKRSSVALFKDSGIIRAVLKLAGWAFAGASFFIFVLSQGWERGVPISLGVLTFAGASVILSGALSGRLLNITSVGALAVSIIACAGVFLAGGGL